MRKEKVAEILKLRGETYNAHTSEAGSDRLNRFSTAMLVNTPDCLAILGEDNKIQECNSRFEAAIGPLYKVTDLPFSISLIKPSDVGRFEDALKAVREDGNSVQYLRGVETLTLSSELPIYRTFNWGLCAGEKGTAVLSGQCSQAPDLEKEANEAELIDFFQNAPIALHWLSDSGHVLWANQTELDHLGYTAEEYIGQPIMKFCPDEQELVLEIFKQLGSGNTIRDVPVRFRTKDGRIRDLLIDSNVNYKTDGSFNHTRCFIRDDTGRKLREARTEAAAIAAERSIKQRDAFIRKTFHEIRTPCHILLQVLSCLEGNTDKLGDSVSSTDQFKEIFQESMELITLATRQAVNLMNILDDAADAARFEQGQIIVPIEEKVNLKVLSYVVLEALRRGMPDSTGGLVQRVVDMSNDGKPFEPRVIGDCKLLHRILFHLMCNSVKATKEGVVRLSITQSGDLYTFAVSDTGCGVDTASVENVFQKYWQNSPAMSEDGRKDQLVSSGNSSSSTQENEWNELDKMDRRLTLSSGNEGMGLGLNVCFNLVQCMGSQLCVSSTEKGSRFWFTLSMHTQPNLDTYPDERDGQHSEMMTYTSVAKSEVRSFDERSPRHTRPGTMPWPAKGSGPTGPETVSTDDSTFEAETQDDSFVPPHPSRLILPKIANLGNKPLDKSTVGSKPAVEYEWGHFTDTEKNPKGVQFVKDEDPAPPSSPQHVRVPPPAAPVTGLGLNASTKIHVLLVEDNTICQKVAQHALNKLSCTCDVAGNGLEALKILTDTPQIYDLILMDLRMPLCDGFEATAKIRSTLRLSIPIIAFTAETGQDIKDLCAKEGFSGFVQKPCTVLDLRLELRRHLGTADAGKLTLPF